MKNVTIIIFEEYKIFFRNVENSLEIWKRSLW